MKKETKSNIFLIFVLFSLFAANFTLADTSYKLGIENGDEMIWEATEYNEEYIEKLINSGFLSTSYLQIEEGHKIKLSVSTLTEESDIWEVTVRGYEGEDLENYAGMETMEVYKDPQDLADKMFDDDNEAVYIVFMPYDVEDYLEELNNSISSIYKDTFYASENKFIQQISSLFKVVSEYNEDGISEAYSLYYNDQVAYKRELKTVENTMFMTILVTSIIAASIIGAIVLFVVLYSRKRKRDKENAPERGMMYPGGSPPTYKPQPQLKAPASAQGPLKPMVSDGIERFCQNCGAPRKPGADFCTNCGKKLL